MPEIKIVTEVAGRVCATPVQVTSWSRWRIMLRSCAPFIIEALIATALGPMRYF